LFGTVKQTMRRSLFSTMLSLLIISIILCATTVGYCHEAHAAEDILCQQCLQGGGAFFVSSGDGQADSSQDAGHCGHDDCASACYCSCHLPLAVARIELDYSPIITAHLTQQTFTPPQEIFLSLFVPPDSLA
jgi:hypothetical protein